MEKEGERERENEEKFTECFKLSKEKIFNWIITKLLILEMEACFLF